MMRVWYPILLELLLAFVFLNAAPFDESPSFSLQLTETVWSSNLP